MKTSDLFTVVTDPSVPTGEIHFVVDGKVVGKITHLDTTPAPVAAEPPEVSDAMVLAFCRTVWPGASREYIAIQFASIRDGIAAALAVQPKDEH